MGKKKKIGALLVTIILGTLIFIGFTNHGRVEAENSGFQTTGTIEAREQDISSKIPGRVTMIATEGLEVSEGELLIMIDAPEIEAKKLQAEAAVMAAEAQLNKALQGTRRQQIAQAEASMAQAEAQVELLTNTYHRMLALYEAEALPKQQLEEIETKLNVAKLTEVAAREQLDLAIEGAQYEDIAAAEALHLQAKAALKETEVYLNETSIYAPIGGRISLVIREKGELVSTGMPILTITDYEDAWVNVNIYETQISQVALGQRVEVKSRAYPAQVFAGEVISINQNPDFAIRKATNDLNDRDVVSYGIKVKLEAHESKLFPGMRVDVKFEGNEG